jgi:hypothetical protein
MSAYTVLLDWVVASNRSHCLHNAPRTSLSPPSSHGMLACTGEHNTHLMRQRAIRPTERRHRMPLVRTKHQNLRQRRNETRRLLRISSRPRAGLCCTERLMTSGRGMRVVGGGSEGESDEVQLPRYQFLPISNLLFIHLTTSRCVGEGGNVPL